jgi:DNA replication protein DnaC
MKRSSPQIDIQASERFLKHYRDASLGLKKLAVAKIHDFVRLYQSDIRIVSTQYDQLEHCNERIVEIPISGGCRLLAHYSQSGLLMCDIGAHEVVPRYSDQKYKTDARTAKEAPPEFFPNNRTSFFHRNPDPNITTKYHEEISPDWVYFLDKTQKGIRDKIVNTVLKFDSTSHFIIGGPGTGKTCILLSLLEEFVAVDYRVGILFSNDLLVEYIESSTRENISQYRVSYDAVPPLDLLLVDDPTYSLLKNSLSLRTGVRVKTIVTAFDPLQLDKPILDVELERLRKENKVNIHHLNECYRQKENVGRAAKVVFDAIAKSSAFLARAKKKADRESRREVTRLANDLDFVNPGGYTIEYTDSTVNDVRTEVNRILRFPHLMWTHFPGLLLLTHGSIDLSDACLLELNPLIQRGYVKQLPLSNVNRVKGPEFQHVFIFIERLLYQELNNGFQGTGTKTYEQRRLLRIPFSRAKDSLVIFAVDED